ncbi:hypothetical protein T03_3504 [Trichinella britovi]|uniref:DUF7107 domain-containing protein n=1 Tax=Trichinella britovi TaxID=45882 RepID=A0A0V1CJN9_TRIBR|nr:hypothetical protein T09_10553 [Trichinella sp. T9]KRX84966.1 hypothetical protein T06_9027 [Trichinella sp. T6]KRY49415.1 hypothetical protein T03_3504 [Trichinella britovi]KRZ84762.1 hypothetical protein T08_3105 [Trichinella sp. T8]
MVYVYFGLLLWQVLIVVSYKPCNTQEDCKDIAICLQKQCVPAKPAGGFCTNNDECNTGQTCVFGLCMVPAVELNSECKTSNDCKKQTICVNGKCKVAATIGKQCKVDSDCDDGQSCRFGVCWFLYLPPVN